MAQYPTPPARPLLDEVVRLLAAHRPAFGQERPHRRCVALALGWLVALGRHTVTGVLVALGLGAADWSGFYRLFAAPRLDYDRLTRCLLREALPLLGAAEATPLLVAVDGVQVPRSSRTMPGTSWLKHPQTPPFKPGIHRAQRFVELDLLPAPTPTGYSRAIPVRMVPALPAKAVPVPGYPPQREWAAGLAEVAWLRRELDAAGQAEQPVLALGDGAYSGQGAWQALAEGVTLLARCPRNRALFRLPPPYPGRGRPRLYGERAPRPDAWLAEGAGWARTELAVRGRTIPVSYRVEGPYVVRGAPERPLFLLVVRGSDPRRGRRRREPAFWLVSTAPDGAGGWRLPRSAERLLAWAWQRWEAEVAHREGKTGFGLGEPQCWGPRSAVLAVQWVAWLYALVVLAGLRVWGQERGPLPPPGRWWRGSGRWSLAQLWAAVRAEVWELGDFRPGWSRSTGRWDEMLDWLALRTNALRGASRT